MNMFLKQIISVLMSLFQYLFRYTQVFYNFRYFCETLLDFYDPSPMKEELRNKIITRLLREGSSADEPSNVALSDYSSLSSGCESSTDEDEANKGKCVLKIVCLNHIMSCFNYVNKKHMYQKLFLDFIQ